ncbi:Nucleoporin nup45 [Beauveria bassiana D1-5]|uniref:Nucleoporin nup45 n=1 Tax=Beauveria bassiana D1-5 TaxID=1245745 RepID=A0A0A2VCJ5_BEABA|nr:Nucleoporin nup45 [Beauveria bassiana D1-5]
MSLARSASGPGGLTINTGAANSLDSANQLALPSSQFSASSSQPQSTGGLFGSATTNTNSNAATATAAGAMATTGGLFGAASAQPKTNLFGASTTTQAPASGGLFGSATPASSAQQQPQQSLTTPASGGVFGSVASQSKPANSLFGGGAAAQPTTSTTNTGLFGGGAAATTQQPAQTGGGVFGSTTTQQQPAQTGTGLFGNAQQGGTGTNTSVFGQSQAKPSGGLFGQSQQPTQTANPVPAVQINYDNLRPRSRFDDLAQPIQDEVALIDKGIQRVIKMRDEIGEFMPQHEKDIQQLGNDVKYVESKFRMVQEALNRDIQTVKSLQDVTKKNIGDAQLSFKAADNLKLPSHYHQTGLFAGSAPSSASNGTDASSAQSNAQDLITYFNRICDDVEKYKKRLDEYRGEIERDMPGVENGLYEQIRSFRDRNAAMNGNGGGVQDQLNQVLSALRETGNAIVAQAGQIADTRERLSRLQAGITDSGLYGTN